MWSTIQEVLITACQIVCGIFVASLLLGLIGTLLAWACFLLKYPMGLVCWIWEKTFPPIKREHVQRRSPEPPPPPPVNVSYSPRINGNPEAIREVVEGCLKEAANE